MNVVPLEAGKAVLVLKLARRGLTDMRKTAGAIPDVEMKEVANRFVNRYEEAIQWLETKAKGEPPITSLIVAGSDAEA